MPTDPSTDPATATTRRAFLARTAVGGAVATAVLATPLRDLLPVAGAQGSSGDALDDPAFGDIATPIELAAVQLYQVAIEADVADADWTDHLATFQDHHRAVADTVATLRTADLASVADPGLLTTYTPQLEGAADQEALLGVLSTLEGALSATHLLAVSLISDPVTAKIVAQVLAIEAQQAAFLGQGAGTELAELTPAEAETTDALDPAEVVEAQPTTTTTTTEAD